MVAPSCAAIINTNASNAGIGPPVHSPRSSRHRFHLFLGAKCSSEARGSFELQDSSSSAALSFHRSNTGKFGARLWLYFPRNGSFPLPANGVCRIAAPLSATRFYFMRPTGMSFAKSSLSALVLIGNFRCSLHSSFFAFFQATLVFGVSVGSENFCKIISQSKIVDAVRRIEFCQPLSCSFWVSHFSLSRIADATLEP